MARSTTKVASFDLTGHEKIIRSYIELRALEEAFIEAKEKTGSIWLPGSDDFKQDLRNKMEQNKRSDFRDRYTKAVRSELIAAFGKWTSQGIKPYLDLLAGYQDKAFKSRRSLDGMIANEMTYANREEKLWGVLGSIAVYVKVRCDMGMVLLGTMTVGVPALLVGLGYSATQDTISAVRDPKEANFWSFHGTGFSIVATVAEKVAKTGTPLKVLKFTEAAASIVESLINAKSDWDKF